MAENRKGKRADFHVDTLLGFDEPISPRTSQTENFRRRKSPEFRQEQNAAPANLVKPINVSNSRDSNIKSTTTAPHRLSLSQPEHRTFDDLTISSSNNSACNNHQLPQLAGLANLNLVQITRQQQQENSLAISTSTTYPTPDLSHHYVDATASKFFSPSSLAVSRTTCNSNMATTKDLPASNVTQSQTTNLTPLIPSLAVLATYPMFNWCAKCNSSFRMTSDLVHHMRTHHKRHRTNE